MVKVYTLHNATSHNNGGGGYLDPRGQVVVVAAVAGADRAVGEVLLAELVLGHGHPVQAARASLGQGQGAAQVSGEQLQRDIVSYAVAPR